MHGGGSGKTFVAGRGCAALPNAWGIGSRLQGAAGGEPTSLNQYSGRGRFSIEVVGPARRAAGATVRSGLVRGLLSAHPGGVVGAGEWAGKAAPC